MSYDGTDLEVNFTTGSVRNIVKNGHYAVTAHGEDRSGLSSQMVFECDSSMSFTAGRNAYFFLQEGRSLKLDCNTESTSCETGALVIDNGGLGVGGNIFTCGDSFGFGDILSGDETTVTINTTDVIIDADVEITGDLVFGADGEGGLEVPGELTVGGELTVEGCVVIKYDHCLNFEGASGDWVIDRSTPTTSVNGDDPDEDLYLSRPVQSADLYFKEMVVYDVVLGPNDIGGSYGDYNDEQNSGHKDQHNPGWNVAGNVEWTGKRLSGSYGEHIWIPIPHSVPNGFQLTDIWYTHYTASGDLDNIDVWASFESKRYDSSSWSEKWKSPQLLNSTGLNTNWERLGVDKSEMTKMNRGKYSYRFRLQMVGNGVTDNWIHSFLSIRCRFQGNKVLPNCIGTNDAGTEIESPLYGDDGFDT